MYVTGKDIWCKLVGDTSDPEEGSPLGVILTAGEGWKERLFNEHIEALAKKKRSIFANFWTRRPRYIVPDSITWVTCLTLFVVRLSVVHLTQIHFYTSDQFDDILEGSEETH